MIEQLRITQTFSQEYKLHNINLTIYQNEIVGIVVRSGANRRGMFQLLTGKAMPNFGKLYLKGKEVSLYGQNIHRYEMGSISKKSQLIPNLSVYENIFVITQGNYFRPLLSRSVYITETKRLLKEAGLSHIDPTVKSLSLSQPEMHIIEIIKMIVLRTKMLVIDDITGGYTENELKRFCNYLVEKKEQGLSILFLTNRFNYFLGIANQITVIRGGTTVTHERNMPITSEALSAYLGDVAALSPTVATNTQNRNPHLELKDFVTAKMDKPVSFTVYKGEVIGGLEIGVNRGTAIGRAIYGLDKYIGQIYLNEKAITIKSNKYAISKGIIYLEANDIENSIFYNMGLIDNITMLMEKKHDKAFGIINKGLMKSKAEKSIDELGFHRLKNRYPLYDPIRQATPIDRMRIQLTKAYAVQPQILLLANPHIGFGEMRLEDFRKLLQTFLNIGTSVVIFSTNRQNLEEVCDRIIEL